MPKKKILTGKKFNRLTVINEAYKKGKDYYWDCICDCGTKRIVHGGNLYKGLSKSCGCYKKELTHGMSRTPENQAWRDMLDRCRNPKNKWFPRYGERGIKVCKRWHKFENFYKDMGKRPKGLTLERIDNDGNYEPGNCEYATRSKQQRNRGLQKNNKTGISGISVDKKDKAYTVYLGTIYIGRFKTLKEATIARKNAEKKYWKGGVKI